MDVSLIGILFLIYVVGGSLLFAIAPSFIDFIDYKTKIYSDAPIIAFAVIIFIWVFLGGGLIFGMGVSMFTLSL